MYASKTEIITILSMAKRLWCSYDDWNEFKSVVKKL